MTSLVGKKAIITGGSRGIGRETAIALAESGCDVAINYITQESAARETAQAIQRLGRQTMVIKADMSEPEDIQAMIESVQQQWGKLDILVSNAASGGFRNILDAKTSHFDSAMHINVRSLMLLVQAALPMLEKSSSQAKVIALSSHGSHRALPAYGLIGAAKAAIESLMRHFADELGPRGINFNVVLAGLVKTDSTAQVPNADAMFAAMNEKLRITRSRTLTARDVANVVRFLASPESDLIQGQTLVVDGGASLSV
ncbi:MAG: SDR family oxidoreductase [Pirellulaceae bacterium]|nr:SDR family oxidoreductase [Pirellulaceae bacterium]